MSVTVKSDSKGKSSDDKIVDEAKERFKYACEFWQKPEEELVGDLEFLDGEQWPEQIKSTRQLDNRPCLVINKTAQSHQQVTNDQRQNRPSIKVSAVDSAADVDTADVIQGLIRHIEYDSNADVAYDRGFEPASGGGYGFFGFRTEYTDPFSFDLDIKFRSIPDPTCVKLDPSSTEPDGSDADWAFIVEEMSKDEFKQRYPKAEISQGDQWEIKSGNAKDWLSEKSVKVAEYFYKEFEKKTLLLLTDGRTVLKDEYELIEGDEVVQERETDVVKIKWCKINGCEILEKTEWPGKYIPIIPVYGKEKFINGKRKFEGLVRNAKDPQRMYNYWASSETEAIALAPRTPFIAAEGQIDEYENDWRTANQRNHSVLKYKPVSSGGTMVPPPQRNVFEPAVQAITNARMMASEDVKSTTGIYDASLGAQSNETSGIAIQRRNNQAQTSNFHYVDNLTRSIRHAGRVLIDLIPKIYDTERAIRIIGEDDEEKIVRVNSLNEDGTVIDLSAGKYDVRVDVGPNFATKRQEAVASMVEVVRANPQMAQFISDLLVKNMDWPGAPEMAERLRKTLPPGIADDEQKDIPPEIQAQMDQAQQVVDQLTEQLNIVTKEQEQKKVEYDFKREELQAKQELELRKLQTNAEIELAKMNQADAFQILNAEIEELKTQANLFKVNGPRGGDATGPQPQPTGGSSPGTTMGEP